MSSLASIGSVTAASTPLVSSLRPEMRAPLAGAATPGAPGAGFGEMLDGLVSNVVTKQTEANDITRRVLLGETDQLHQSVIAMQEASVAFGLMVEVRNKLVESYQELMRMQV